MCRDYVRRSGLVYFFLDPDAAECGTCRARTKGQIYWYIVRPNYSEFGPHISGGLVAYVGGLIDAVVGLATPVLLLLAWIASAICAKITGIRLWW
jgi:hypothetical protein